jgi:hypothetical protein
MEFANRCLTVPAVSTTLWGQGTTGTRAASPIFEFHSGFWLNLHHFLFEQATAGPPAASDPPEWSAAVDYYRREVIQRALLSDDAARIADRLSQLDAASSLRDSGLPPDLIRILEAAAPAYKARWWPEHDRANRAWIEGVQPLVAKYGDGLRKDLAAVYQTDWPAGPIRTDVAEYASWAGAYTTLGPVHITVSSADPKNQGDAALEVVFHEASHALVGRVRRALSDEAGARNKLFRRRDFWHAILFYTAGELVRRRLIGYTPYGLGNGLYERVWQGAPEVLDKDWKPYIDGRINLATAISRLVDDYGVAR